MSKKRLKITEGKFEATPDNSSIYRRKIKDLYEYGGGVAGDKPIVFVNKGFYGKDDKGYNVKANAELIADAFNTANETQLLPSELKEQRDELLGVLKGLVSDVGNLLGEHDFEWQQAGYFNAAKELIDKTKRQ